ncbi:MAG: phosphotransferase [Candidatus Kerfeldbacteria bacterium]
MQQIARKATLTTKQLETALASFRLGKCKKITYLRTGVINANYVVSTDRGRFIVRSYTFKARSEVESEVFLLTALRRKGFPCPEPVGSVVTIGGNPVCCFRYIEGRTMQHVTRGSSRRIAKLLARMHLLTEDMRLPFRREGEGVAVIRRYVKTKKRFILKSRFKGRAAFIRFLERELAGIRIPAGLPRGVIHADVKSENIVGPRRHLSFIDFDNAYVDAFVIDIGYAISWLCLNTESLDVRKVREFVKAYELVRRLAPEERSALPTVIRFVLLKHAFKYAYVFLRRLRFAERKAYHFIQMYHNASFKKF